MLNPSSVNTYSDTEAARGEFDDKLESEADA